MFIIGSAIVATKSSDIFNIYKLPVQVWNKYKHSLQEHTSAQPLFIILKKKTEVVPVVFVSPALKPAMGFSEVITFNT